MEQRLLQQRIKNALDEARMLALGTQVLLGFQYRAFFEPRFWRLPELHRKLELYGLLILLAVIALLLLPAARHRIVERGHDSLGFHHFTMTLTSCALFPFALALAVDTFIAASEVVRPPASLLLAGATLVGAMAFWYGVAFLGSRRSHPSESKETMARTSLEDRITQVLTEARVVLPGAQAVLGFQLAMVLMESFDTLPRSSKLLHLASLSSMIATIIFLMAPAAYHRVVEKGQDSERFHTFASTMVIAAMATLPLGFAGDLAVVIRLMTDSPMWEAIGGAATIFAFYAVWFGVMFYLRGARRAATARY